MYDLVIKDGTLLTGSDVLQLDLAVQAGRIAAIGSGLAGREERSAAGLLVLPGAVDPHVHIQMPAGATITSDTWAGATRAAVYGGTTTVIDFIEPSFPGQPLMDAYRERSAEAAGQSALDFSFHMTLCDAEAGTLAQVPAVLAAGMPSFKVYTTYTGFRLGDEELLAVFDAVHAAGGLVIVHAESDSIIRRAQTRLKQAGRLGVADFPESRPALAEAEAVRRVLALAESCSAPVYIVHVSTAAGAQAIGAARRAGQAAWGETCPQYLLLDDRLIRTSDFSGAKYVCCPPLRTPADQAGLWSALQAGDLQTLGTDHCAFNFEGQKEMGREAFMKIPAGLPGIETRLRLLYTYGVQTGRLSLAEWAALCCTWPARLFGLYPRKGVLLPGADADIVFFDPHARAALRHSDLHEEVDYTPYEGLPVSGAVRDVLLRGESLVRDGRWVGPEHSGQFVAGQAFGTRLYHP